MNFITVISAISVVGVTIGVAAMIIVLSVFNGFHSKVTDLLIGFDPYIRIESKNSGNINDYEKFGNIVKEFGINSVAPFTLNKECSQLKI